VSPEDSTGPGFLNFLLYIRFGAGDALLEVADAFAQPRADLRQPLQRAAR
jgi:hypothetical protein